MREETPKTIYLQWFGEDGPEMCGTPVNGEVSWCEDKVFEHDVKYVRADEAEKQIAALEAQLATSNQQLKYVDTIQNPAERLSDLSHEQQIQSLAAALKLSEMTAQQRGLALKAETERADSNFASYERLKESLSAKDVELREVREYIDIAADVIAWLLIAAKFPTLEAVFADSDPSRLARMIELKEALLSKSSTSPTAKWCSDSDEITKAGPQSSHQTTRSEGQP